MSIQFFCSYLNSDVELTNERQLHITEKHPDLDRGYQQLIANTLLEPNEVRCDVRFENTILLSTWYPNIRKGRYIVVVVVTNTVPEERNWIVTAYLTAKITQGEIIWTQN